ncbi:uncharacterized protein PgNI_02978, partial [Pyricularia grisea]|uniref:Uncharacterized protein n=1 Tax=Pyricularia grisea TaxID=148305 RepID=A0A6P8BDB6_PYRGI
RHFLHFIIRISSCCCSQCFLLRITKIKKNSTRTKIAECLCRRKKKRALTQCLKGPKEIHKRHRGTLPVSQISRQSLTRLLFAKLVSLPAVSGERQCRDLWCDQRKGKKTPQRVFCCCCF